MITILQNTEYKEGILFEAKDADEVLGTLICEIDTDTLVIKEIKSISFLIDGLCRAALNYAFNRFVNKCRFEKQEESVLKELLRLDFVQIDNYSIDNIDNFFTSHKNCKK